MNSEQKVLYEVLKMPIKEKVDIESYYIHGNHIFTGYKYSKTFDADMSNVAIKFYSLLYGVQEEQILSKECRHLKGDTMNSKLNYFKQDTELKNKWNDKKYCLANFWLLPMDVGRTVKLPEAKAKLAKHSRVSKLHDYMDNFLIFIGANTKDYFDLYNEYFAAIQVYQDNFSDDFPKVHYLNNAYYDNDGIKIINKKELINGYQIWENMIDARARQIATSDNWKYLYDNLVKSKFKR